MNRSRKQVDGDKFVCLDQILNNDSCIVYSFGVANDWTFEDQIDNIGFMLLAINSVSLIRIRIQDVMYLLMTTQSRLQLIEGKISSSLKLASVLENISRL